MNKWLKTLLFLAGSALLTRFIPFSSLFRNLDTMFHEFGHALVTLLLSGSVLRIELYPDHSGVTYSAIAAGGGQFLYRWPDILWPHSSHCFSSIYIVETSGSGG